MTDYEIEKAPMGGCASEVTPSMTESLRNQRTRAADHLAKLDKTIQLIESQPEVQKILDALSQLGKLRNL